MLSYHDGYVIGAVGTQFHGQTTDLINVQYVSM